MIADIKLAIRYNGIGKPLNSTEKEFLLCALYNESEANGGIAAEARRKCDAMAAEKERNQLKLWVRGMK